MGVGVDEPEHAPQHVREHVLQRGAGRTERHAGEVGPVQQLVASGDVCGRRHHDRQ